MGIAKVILNSQTLIDVTQKTVTASTLFSGLTALGRDGENVVGTYIPQAVPMYQSKTVTPTTTTQVVVPDEGTITVLNNITDSASSYGTTGATYSTGFITSVFREYVRINGTISVNYNNSSNPVFISFNNVIIPYVSSSNWYPISSSLSGVTISGNTGIWSEVRSFRVQYSYRTPNNYELVIPISLDIPSSYTVTMTLTNLTIELSDDPNFGQAYDALSSVTVNPIPSDYVIPAGTLSVLADGTYDVKSYASVSVSVGGGGGGGGITADQVAARTISGVMTGSASQIGAHAFDYCDITEANFPNATRIQQSAFYYCQDLTTAYFPSVSVIETDAFNYCRSLTTISFPNTTAIADRAFHTCNALTTASFPLASKIPDYCFAYCISLTAADFPSASSIGAYAFAACYSLTTVSIPNAITISNYAFSSCSSLTNVYFPSATSIGANAFAGCLALENANCPNVTYIGNSAFYGCTVLSEAEIPNVSYIGAQALARTGLTTASFSNVTSLGSMAFYSCRSLMEANFPSITIISTSTFYSCDVLSVISFPSVTSIGNNAFARCGSLELVEFPNVTNVMNSAFSACGALTTAIFPVATSIGLCAFSGCSLLTTVSFPNVKNIGNMAFYGCSSLATASFPNATSIGSSAFYLCRILSALYLMGSTVASVGMNVLSFTPIQSSATLGYYGSIYVPASLLTAYQSSTNWSVYSSRFVGL